MRAHVAVFINQLAVRNHMRRAAGHLKTFEDAAVDFVMLRFRANRARLFRIEHDKIGIGANGNRALARIHAENAARIRGEEIHELMAADVPGAHTMMPQQAHAIFNRRAAIGDHREIIFAHGLLRHRERAMIRACGLNHTGFDAIP